ncbi:hypothetical protein [Actinomadura chokoriensis]|uniref:hypothetical protein n=1 Tax=Actinomadura chokoriensis TaxID=454156 RepID=UPI0031F7BF81
MCLHDLADREAAIARFLEKFPSLAQASCDHPALQGLDDTRWADIPGCPAQTPAVFAGLLDAAAAPEAVRVLGIVLNDGLFQVSTAMPTALPYLIRLAVDPAVPARAELVELLAVTAVFSEPLAPDDNWSTLLGPDCDHPERPQCKAVFLEHADALRLLAEDASLPEELVGPQERSLLLQAAAPL